MVDTGDLTADQVDLSPQLTRLLQHRGTVAAVLFSSDGLALAHSDGTSRETAERTAALCSGLASLTGGLAEFCGTTPDRVPLRYLMIDCRSHTVLVLSAGTRTGLALSVAADSLSAQVQEAIRAAGKTIHGLRSALETRERDGVG
ncbi:roadblock/LC7 domain-containing protein [Streptomyces sp. NPDC087866]|uniref:roadblock/LC7 domain-containing protein n=1 Tax=unclassified Streptomyces TaxID=2593676 RepID=UPI0033B02E59